MYSNKQNVLQLVSLMCSHGVKKCVLCPGSRDIPIVQSILQCQDFETYSITDERSAGFFAIGLSLQSNCNEPVAVVVTSGSALLGLHPAVSEAFYQNVPLLVISADRPAAWIGQMDGQTLPQAHVFKTLVKKSVGLVEIQSSEDHWFNNRMINEALLELFHHGRGPVHINVPISDPFFEFSTKELPQERVINRICYDKFVAIEHFKKAPVALKALNLQCEVNQEAEVLSLAHALVQCKSILLVIGQSPDFLHLDNNDLVKDGFAAISKVMGVICESISNVPSNFKVCSQIDMVVTQFLSSDGGYRQYFPNTKCALSPDLVITIGGHIISKNLKKFLRSSKPKYHFHISSNGEVVDLFKCLSTVIEMDEARFLKYLTLACRFIESSYKDISNPKEVSNLEVNLESIFTYAQSFNELCDSLIQPTFAYSHMLAMQLLRANLPDRCILHLANSSTVRYDQLFLRPYSKGSERRQIKVMSNRGVNGIEGSLSTAIGYASSSDLPNFIVIGDLSFFYDMNALWNDYIGKNIRIVLLNNGGGEIFHALPGLNLNDNEKKYVTAQHKTHAQAWAESRGFEYHQVTNESSLKLAIYKICTEKELNAPQFVEVLTKAQSDASMLKKVMRDCISKAHKELDCQ